IEGRLDVAVLRLGGRAERFGIGEVADDRLATASCDAARFLGITDERGHLMTAAHESFEHRPADVSRRAGQEDAHDERNSLHHNSLVTRDTLLDFFADLARAHGEFLVHDDGFRTRRYSYEQVVGAAYAFADRLREAGIDAGDHVIFWSENRPEWI